MLDKIRNSKNAQRLILKVRTNPLLVSAAIGAAFFGLNVLGMGLSVCLAGVAYLIVRNDSWSQNAVALVAKIPQAFAIVVGAVTGIVAFLQHGPLTMPVGVVCTAIEILIYGANPILAMGYGMATMIMVASAYTVHGAYKNYKHNRQDLIIQEIVTPLGSAVWNGTRFSNHAMKMFTFTKELANGLYDEQYYNSPTAMLIDACSLITPSYRRSLVKAQDRRLSAQTADQVDRKPPFSEARKKG